MSTDAELTAALMMSDWWMGECTCHLSVPECGHHQLHEARDDYEAATLAYRIGRRLEFKYTYTEEEYNDQKAAETWALDFINAVEEGR